jgi:cytosine/adenosine deaminase-related metal-dependent hydrolase
MPVETAPIDPLNGPKLAISGRIVTMNDHHRVLANGVLYIEGGRIVAITERSAPKPEGFAKTKIVDTEGTIFPGLIELHNHLPYNVLPLWHVPKKYTSRSQWGASPEYSKRITTPMSILGRSSYVPSVARYVECKTLLSGVTTTQGIELFSNAGARRFYKGVVRNVEQTDDTELPEATTRIADIDARDAKRFLERLEQGKKLILHLSEGIGSKAREHFSALHLSGRTWAINENLVGIHCAGLQARDFHTFAAHGGSMVWSPFSNLLLYGETADVKAAKQEGVPIALGPDWSPTGSKNILGELKVARVVSRQAGNVFSDVELVEMVTTNAAQILGWQSQLGSLEVGKRADVMVIDAKHSDPYVSLLRSNERDVRLVMINGVARAGVPSLVRALAGKGEELLVGGRPRAVYLKQKEADPDVASVKLSKAIRLLQDTMADLQHASRKLIAPNKDPHEWNLALDELMQTGISNRPKLRGSGPELPRTLSGPADFEAIPLDALSVVDDDTFLDLVAEEQHNLPGFLAGRLRSLYA